MRDVTDESVFLYRHCSEKTLQPTDRGDHCQEVGESPGNVIEREQGVGTRPGKLTEIEEKPGKGKEFVF